MVHFGPCCLYAPQEPPTTDRSDVPVGGLSLYVGTTLRDLSHQQVMVYGKGSNSNESLSVVGPIPRLMDRVTLVIRARVLSGKGLIQWSRCSCIAPTEVIFG